jgi:hypothetical protein
LFKMETVRWHRSDLLVPNVDQSLISCHHLCLYKSQNDKQSKQFVHMLNSTLTATERTLCCILENYQKEDGVEVPKVLQPYMDGIDFLPFKRPLGSKQASDAKPNKSKPKVCLSLWFSSFPRKHVKSTHLSVIPSSTGREMQLEL